jgi:hypothetical protein
MSRIVDVLEAERVRYRNHRYGRDYYTKLASSPSGKAKNDEEHDFRPPDEDAEVSWYRAVPATTNESDQEERTSSVRTEKEDVPTNQLEITSDSDLSLVNFYDVENSKIYFQSSDNDQPEFRITLNKKAPNMFNGDNVKWQSPVVRVNEKEPIFYSPEESQQPVKTEPLKAHERGVSRDDDEEKNENKTNVQNIVITTKKSKQVEHETKIYRPTIDGRKESEINNNGVSTAKRADPLISTKKWDNTLIKKIYSNPVVRSFALTNREQIPYETEPQVTKVPLTPVTPVKEFTPPKYEYSTGYATTPVREFAPPKYEYSAKTPVKEEAPPKFEHGTGYAKTPVREFAPPKYEYSTAKQDASPKHEYNSSYIMRPAEKLVDSQEERGEPVKEELDKRDMFGENRTFSLEFSENGSSKEPESDDFDVNELRERKLVASRLGQFSKSFPNLMKIKPAETQHRKPDEGAKEESEANSGDASPVTFVSVRDLKKLFERRDAARYEKDKPVHSLTARSISKQMKETLKGDSSIHNGNSFFKQTLAMMLMI